MRTNLGKSLNSVHLAPAVTYDNSYGCRRTHQYIYGYRYRLGTGTGTGVALPCHYTVHALKKLTFYGRTTPTATGVLRSRLRAYDGYGRATLTATGVLGLRLRAYYAYGYGRIAATTTGVHGLAAGCKLTSGHYNHER